MRLAWSGAVAVVAVSAAPAWQFRNWQWFALAVTAAVVLPALHDPYHSPDTALPRAARCGQLRSSVGPVAAAGTAAGAVAALAWSVTTLLGGAGTAGFVQAAGAPVLALDTAAVLGALLLLPPAAVHPADAAGRIAARLGALVVTTAVAVLGFRLGAGDAAGAGAAAAAVLIAGCPCALLLLPVPAPGPSRLRVRAEHGEGVLRVAAALHACRPEPHPGPAGIDDRAVRGVGGPWPADPVGRAVLATAGRRYATLPGVSDADGDPATGLRGVVSELTDDVVLAHAVLVGPPQWLSAHGVSPTADALRAVRTSATATAAPGTPAPDGNAPCGEAPAGRSTGAAAGDAAAGDAMTTAGGTPARGAVWCVAWDGEARGWLELVAVPRPGALRRRVAIAVAVPAAGLGAGAAAAGALSPATAGVLPVAAALLVVALRMLPAPDRTGRGHPDRGYQRVR